jgi:DNA primase
LGRIPEQVVSEIRERADIVSVVGRHVTLKRQGNRHWGLCPFHDEKTPSFQVHEDKQIFYCFGCLAGGDVFAFRMKQDGIEFPDAVRALARELGIAIPEATTEESQAGAIYRANEAAASYFHTVLRSPEGAEGRQYLAERGVPEDLVERFRVGFAPAGWDGLVSHLRRNRISQQDAETAGLIAARQNSDGHYDRFRHRLMFPISEPGGQIAGFGGRAMGDDTPKYLNSPETPVYRKSRTLFGLPHGLDAIRERGRVIVVEGYFDLLALHRAGIPEGVAPCGTALTQNHAHRIRRYAPEVVLLFDGDAAGQAAAERALPILLAEGLRVRAAFLPLGEDPDTLVGKSGAAALRACVDSAVPLLDHLIERALKEAATHAWGAADVARSLAPYLRAVTDPVERATYVRELSSRLQVPPAAVDESLRLHEKASAPARPAQTLTPAAPQKPIALDPAVRDLIAALAAHPELLPHFETLELDWVAPGPGRELLAQLRAASAEHGKNAVATLLSPESDALGAELRALFNGVIAASLQCDLRTSQAAVGDCIRSLKKRELDRRAREITTRLGSCTDAAEITTLLERKQQILDEIRDL